MPNSPLLPARDTPMFVVLNVRAGSGDAAEAEQTIQRVLDAAGQAHRLLPVSRPEMLGVTAQRAVDAAREYGGAVVVAGGDGTINAVAQAALPFELPFGIIPQGTFNYSGRAHGIPLEPEAATRALLHARLEPIQVGLANDRIFLVNAALGLYPQLLQDRETYLRLYGRSRAIALWSGLRSLLQEHRQLALEIEHDEGHEIVHTPTLFVGNNPLQLERVGLPGAQDVQHRRLAAIIVRAYRPSSLLWLALRGALGRLGDSSNVRSFTFRRMTVTPWLRHGRRDIRIAIDGEVLHLRPPLRFSVAPQALWLMRPAQIEDA